MFYLTKPNENTLQQFIDSQGNEPFSYPEVGASRVAVPAGYNIDHNRVQVGEGRGAFAKATASLKSWKMFELDWIELLPKKPPAEIGMTVGVLVRHFGFRSLSVSRIVYTIAEDDRIERYGFAYGTLPGHVECGEERFTVEYHPSDKTVWYDLYAFSKPQHILAKAAYPISRLLQKRFARDSLRAMQKAVTA